MLYEIRPVIASIIMCNLGRHAEAACCVEDADTWLAIHVFNL